MKAIRTLLFLPILLAGTTSDTPAEPADRINICHITQVTESGLFGSVITIPALAWPAHERHLDFAAAALNAGDPCGLIIHN